MQTNDEPLIWTTKGNMPTRLLEHYVGFEVTDEYVKFVEVYKHEGEVVKESCHVHNRKGIELGAAITT